MRHIRTSVVIPVRDEDPFLVEGIVLEGQRLGYEVLLIDDGSKDPVAYATVRFDPSVGYGAALKAGISRARGDLVITMDGDGQHTWRDVQRLEEFLWDFPEVALVIGDRRVHEASALRYWGRKGLNMLASLFAWEWVPDLNGGLRGFRREQIQSYLPILCDQFSFTTSSTLAYLCDNHVVDWLPIHVLPRSRGTSKVRVIVDGGRTLWYIVWIGGALRTRRLRAWLRRLHLTQWAQPLLRLVRPR